MPPLDEMITSLDDARWFNDRIDDIVRGPQATHNLTTIRRYFRAYLHCWKTVLHLVRVAKGLDGPKYNKQWAAWCHRWQSCLGQTGVEIMDQLRETRDYDTHSGTIVVTGEVAAGLFPIVCFDPVKPSHVRRELISCTRKGLEVADLLIKTHGSVA